MSYLKPLLLIVSLTFFAACTSMRDVKVVPREPASAGSYPIVGTNQDTYWDNEGKKIPAPGAEDALYGQDVQFPRIKANYTKSRDDLTVKDEVTGLTWQRDYEIRMMGTCNWLEAQNMVDEMNSKKVGGFTDWRLPTIKELYSLWSADKGWPYIDTTFFPITAADERELSHAIFWSSDKYTGVLGNITDGMSGSTPGTELAFGVNFGTGHIKAYSITSGPKHFMRAVRGNLSYGVNLFKDNGDGTISDLATGLMWVQADSGAGMDWEKALAYAQTQNKANYSGHNDWRLPNAKELQSVVDYTRSPGAQNPAQVGPSIDPLFSCTPITNESGKPDYPFYWTSTSAKGKDNEPYIAAWYVAFGRAVDSKGEDLHGAGAVRFDKKVLVPGQGMKDAERVLNYVRLVRSIQ